MDQPKIERMLRLLIMLTGNFSYTINDLCERLDLSSRSIYRYIDTFRCAGFVIKSNDNFIRIDKSSPHFKEISNTLHFTEEEAHILKKAIDSIDEINVLKQNLKKKLATVYDYKILAETTMKGKNADNVNLLIDAIENKKQVVLEKYSSANSNNVKNRLVEAFAFTTNYIQLWAYEVESGEVKLFKVARIGNVKILNDDWKFQSDHKKAFIDIFRISSLEQSRIVLKMSLRAAMLLIEEYPLAEKDMTKISDNEWLLETKVCSFEGVGRFVIGLFDEIKIVENEEFKNFIRKKVKNISL